MSSSSSIVCLKAVMRCMTSEIKHYEILKDANIPLVVENKFLIDEDFVKRYCDNNLKMRIKASGLDPASLLSKNSQNSLKSDISVIDLSNCRDQHRHKHLNRNTRIKTLSLEYSTLILPMNAWKAAEVANLGMMAIQM